MGRRKKMTGPGIYRIVNRVNGKCYYGSSQDINERMNNHKSELNNNVHDNIHLQRAWNVYGEHSFDFHTVCYTNDGYTALYLEQILLDMWWDNGKTCYNISPDASSCAGVKHSEEYCASISERMSGENHPMYGKKHSSETIKKMSEVKMGERNPFYGRTHTPETIQRISEIGTGRGMSDVAKENLSQAQKGHIVSAETRAKLSANHLGRAVSPEAIELAIRAKCGDGAMTYKKAAEIRAKHNTGDYLQRELAQEYGVSPAAIWRIVNKQAWMPIDNCASMNYETANSIRVEYKTGKCSQQALADKYRTSLHIVSQIVNNRTWVK